LRQHLDALIALQRVWSGFAALTGLSLAVLAIGTTLALHLAGRLGPAQQGVVWLFAGCALLFVCTGAGGFIAVRGLRRRRIGGRFLALALAVVNLVIVPFGTALGIYALWVLLNNDARREFGRPLRGPRTAA
jgi:hypothetical protein